MCGTRMRSGVLLWCACDVRAVCAWERGNCLVPSPAASWREIRCPVGRAAWRSGAWSSTKVARARECSLSERPTQVPSVPFGSTLACATSMILR